MNRWAHSAGLAILLSAGSGAHAITSTYPLISVAGSFNGFSTTANPMTLVADHQWQADIALPASNRIAFLFVTNGGFGTTWKETDQTWFGPWLHATAEFNAGVDMVLSNTLATVYRFSFHETTRVYRVEQRYTNAVSWTSRFPYVNLAGSFNGFETLNPNMELISNGTWQSYVSFTNATNVTFLFATTNFGVTWKEVNQTVFTLPLSGQAEFNIGNDLILAGTINGTLRFQFNEFTGRYLVENVTAAESGALEPWINEFHYDNVGADTNEFIEIAGPAGLNLTNYTISLYNGSGGAVYSNRVLSGTLANQSNGFGAAFILTPGIQNGDPDGIALARINPPALIEFISYGGSFTGVGGPANGVTATDIGVRESGTTPVGFSLQRIGTGAVGSAFSWVGPRTNSPGLLNSNQVAVAPPAPVNVLLSNLTHTPVAPGTSDTVHISVAATAVAGASNLTLTAFYRVNSNGLFVAQPMFVTGGVYRTINPIPALPAGSVVEYFAHALFRGPGTNSPVRQPAHAPANVARYGVSRIASSTVWINEIDPNGDFLNSWEFIEILGWAGADLSGYTVRLIEATSTNIYADYVLPPGSVLPNQFGGFGRFLLGTPDVPSVNLVLTNLYIGEYIANEGGVVLLNEFGQVQHAVWYGLSSPTGFTHAEYDPNDFGNIFMPHSISLTGTGQTLAAFSWGDGTPTPGSTNIGQVLTGGNTNPIPPTIICPSNLFLSCPSSAVPPPNIGSVSTVNYCVTGSVTVTHVGDVTNSGSGCFGSPKIITRTYRAVACGATSVCSQVITIQDSGPPSITIAGGTQTLVNAGFESGSLFGWTPFGPDTATLFATVIAPYQGFAHGIYVDPAPDYAEDSTGNGNDGRIIGEPMKGRAGTNRIVGTAFSFNGTNAYIDIPFNSGLNSRTTFSFSVWTRWEAPTNEHRVLLASRGFSPDRGFALQGSNGVWQFLNGQSNTWHNIGGPSVVSGQWVHIVGTYSNQHKRLYINGALHAASNAVAHTASTSGVLRIGAGASEAAIPLAHYRGSIDDVQFFSRALSPAEVTTLFNAGAGGPTGEHVQAHLKLDESAVPTNTSYGLMQALPAAFGQTWTVSGYMAMPAGSPLQLSNRATLELQFLNAATALLSAVTSQPLTATSPRDEYLRFAASGLAPSNTAFARAVVRHTRNHDASGRFYFDGFVLSRFTFDPGTNCTVSLPDLRASVSASDACGVVATNQSPAPGALLGPGDYTVTFTAVDPCGQSATTQVSIAVVDSVPPVLMVSNITVECDSLIAVTSGVTVLDCSPVSVFLLSDSVTEGSGCAASPRIITRTLQATDAAGFTVFASQIITQRLTSAPAIVCSATGLLLNASFEIGTALTNWNRFGNAISSLDVARSGGVRSARLAGLNNGGENFSGIYQDLEAQGGQHWRAAGWVYIPTNNPISGSNEFRLKLEFVGHGEGFLGVVESPPIGSGAFKGAFFPISVQGIAPAGTRRARLTALYVQRADAPGTVYFDDASLNMSTFTANTNHQYELPDLTRLWINNNPCADVTVTQNIAAGTLLPLGATTVQLVARNQCNLSRTCAVTVVVIKEEGPIPPAPDEVAVVGISLSPTNVTIRSVGTNTWSVQAEYTTNLLGLQQWWPVPSISNVFLTGTNITSFDPPVTNSPVFYRIWQKYP